MIFRGVARPSIVVVGAFAVAAACPVLPGAVLAQADPLNVEPGELGKREDLIGKLVVVDDRVARIQFHPGRGFDQIYLKRAPVVPMDLPERFWFKKSPTATAVRVTGIVRRDAGRTWVDVTAVDLLPADLDRLNSAVATIARVDFEKRLAWVRWAEARAAVFDDETLRARSRQIEVEILRDEAERPGQDPAAHWLGLAERARKRGIPEPEPSALAHRGFRDALGKEKSVAALDELIERIAAFFPLSARPIGAGDPIDVGRWRRLYENHPAEAYRSATETERRALDRALWVDASVKRIERQSLDVPTDALALAQDVEHRIPERTDLARRLYVQALEGASKNPGTLGGDEIERLSAIYRDRLNEPEKARALQRDWLHAQRESLRGTRDAEGRIALAGRFERLLDDREAAQELLREAAAVEPNSPRVAEAYLVRGFRKVDGRWVAASNSPSPIPQEGGSPTGDEASNGSGIVPSGPSEPSGSGGDGLIGATPEQVRARMGGRPNRRVVTATQGQILEQWIYSDPREHRYVNFLHRPGDPRPRVVSYFSLSRAPRRNVRAGD